MFEHNYGYFLFDRVKIGQYPTCRVWSQLYRRLRQGIERGPPIELFPVRQ